MAYPYGGQSPVERIANRLEENQTGCMVWTGFKNELGAGLFYGRIRVGQKLKLVHRVVWEAVKGEIPDGFKVGWKCRNTLCCNVEHMFLFPAKSDADRR